MQDIELIEAFLTESIDLIDEAEPKLIELQRIAEGTGEIDQETINSIFRLFHSIKGSAGFLQMENITAVTHEAETLLDMLRKGKLSLQPNHIALMCESCDLIRKLMNTIEETQSDVGFEDEVEATAGKLTEAMQTGNSAAPAEEDEQMTDEEMAALNASEPAAEPEATEPASDDESAIIAALLDDDEPEEEEAPPPAQATDTSQMLSPDMIQMFVQDAEELLDSTEHALLDVEKDPSKLRECIQDALRAMHTLKGNSGLVGLFQMQELGHSTETIFQGMRDGKIKPEPSLLKFLLRILDAFRKCISDLGEHGKAEMPGYLGLLDLLKEYLPEKPKQKKAAEPAPEKKAPAETTPAQTPEPKAQPPAPTPATKTTEKAAPAGKAPTGGGGMTRRDVRVNVNKLDTLNNLVGELVIASAMVTHNTDLKGLQLQNFDRAAHQLNLITTELQDIAMSLRMIPVEATFRKMIRLVHDLSTKAGKKVDLQLKGVETEVDRTVAELISDPLVHMVRNAVDHGIETPEERAEIGKPEMATLIIEAKHQSGEIWVSIIDDGRGLNRDKIFAKAVERGLIAEGDTLRDEDVYSLIFEPGFSTADKVTDVSGRGVGMDVVKKNMEKMMGRIDTHSEWGIGTTFTIRIPLTLAIIQGMLTRIGNERYIIPLLSIQESFRPTKDMISTVTNRGEMISIRGNLLPLFRLSELFSVENAIETAEEGIIIVVDDGGQRTALLTDELLGQQQIVIKSLGDCFSGVKGIAGASIMSDGKVSLILDIGGIVRIATN